jgi:hypothetical protein
MLLGLATRIPFLKAGWNVRNLCWLHTAFTLLAVSCLFTDHRRRSSSSSQLLDLVLQSGGGLPQATFYNVALLEGLRTLSTYLRSLILPNGRTGEHQDAGEGLRALFRLFFTVVAGGEQLLLAYALKLHTVRKCGVCQTEYEDEASASEFMLNVPLLRSRSGDVRDAVTVDACLASHLAGGKMLLH